MNPNNPPPGVDSPWPSGGGSEPMADPPPLERRCRATNRQKQQCRQYALPGLTVCYHHGGGSRAARAAGARRVAEAKAAELLGRVWNRDATPVTDPVSAAQRLAGQLQHAVDVLGGRLDDGDLSEVTATAWRAVVRELRQLLLGLERLGIAERQVELQQETALIVSTAFKAALAAAGRDLLPAAREEMTTVFLSELRTENDQQTVRGEIG